MGSELGFRKLSVAGRASTKHSTTQYLLLAILIASVLTSYVSVAAVNQPADTHAHDRWLQEHLLSDQAQLPFSFVYDKQGSSALLKAWPKKIETKQLDTVRTEHVVTWADPKSGFQVRMEALEFAHSPVVEWTAYFKNGGKDDAPILEYVQALDVSFAVSGEGIPTILYSKGCGVMDTYALQKKTMNQLESFRISNEGGGKTADYIPFFDIQTSGRGLIGAL